MIETTNEKLMAGGFATEQAAAARQLPRQASCPVCQRRVPIRHGHYALHVGAVAGAFCVKSGHPDNQPTDGKLHLALIPKP